MQPRHVFFQSSNERACWFSNKNNWSIERQTDRREKRMITGSWEEWFHLPTSHLKPCLISVSTLCFSRWISPNSSNSSSCPGEKEKTDRNQKWTCWMRRKVHCWCVLWLWGTNVSHTSDKQQTDNSAQNWGSARCKTRQVSKTDWGLSYCEPKQQGNRGRKWVGWGGIFGSSPAQTLLSMMYKKAHFTIKLFTMFRIAAKWLTAAAATACYGYITIFGYF